MSQVSSATANAARLNTNTSPTASVPDHLTVRFTNVSDMRAVTALFERERKSKMDPTGKVRARSAQELFGPVSSGSALIAVDPSDNIRFFGMSSDHYSVASGAVGVTELGGIMCDLPGFKVAQLGSAMLALNEAIRLREENPCFSSRGVHALVARNNGPANKIFGRELAWQDIAEDDAREQLFVTQNKHSCVKARGKRIWYEFGESARDKARDVITNPLAQGYLSARSGHRIPVTLDTRTHSLV